jgi:hypothetical protein
LQAGVSNSWGGSSEHATSFQFSANLSASLPTPLVQ